MNRLGKLFIAVALVTVPAACKKKEESRREADKAAEKLKEQKKDLQKQSGELRDATEERRRDERGRMSESEAKKEGKEVGEQAKDVGEESKEVATAKTEFDAKRATRLKELMAVHSVYASQPMLINNIAAQTPLTDKAKNDLSQKMQVFQMRLDESKNAIHQLRTANEQMFQDRDDAAAKAMGQLKDARDDAWNALNKGDRVQPS